MPRKPSRDKCLQTVSVTYVVDGDGRALLETLRRDYSRAVRTAYANVDRYDTEKDLRDHLKAMFYRGNDACASATEIARRGLASRAKKKLLPRFEEGWCPRRWKDVDLPVETGTWVEVHRRLKTAKIGVRRPHPDVREAGRGSDRRRKGFTTVDGYAVLAVDRRRKPRGIALRRIVDLPWARDSRHPKTVVGNSRERRASTSNGG